MGTRLNVCGGRRDEPEGWTTVFERTFRDDLFSSYADESLEAIRLYYVAEALNDEELNALARQCHRTLSPGGTLDVISPSLGGIVDIYQQRRNQESIDLEDTSVSPLEWLDKLSRNGSIYPERLLRAFSRFALHQFRNVELTTMWDVGMTCEKAARPLASIVLSTRNKAKYLDVSLASIDRQQVPFPYEVIVVDDGSTDDTKEVCRKWSVQYYFVENDRYRNPSLARNVGYRAARGEIIICQSDDIVHLSPNAIEFMATDLREGEFLLATVTHYKYTGGEPKEPMLLKGEPHEYCSPRNQKPYFFLGSLWRRDLYAVGGCDEEFVEPCFDDNWFADCLMKGLKLKPRWTDAVQAHHQAHSFGQAETRVEGYEKGTHTKEHLSRLLYRRKVRKARRSKVYVASGGPWADGQQSKRMTVSAPVSLPRLPVAQDGDHSGCIPRVMNFFWAGDRMSWMRLMTLYSFRLHHPAWRIVLHRTEATGGKQWKSSETMDSQTYHGRDYSPCLESATVEFADWHPPLDGLAPAHACDFCQWELLGQGGWYADMDVLFVAPLDDSKLLDADAVFCLSDGYMSIGLVGASGNPLFVDILRSARENYQPDKYQSTGAEAVYRLAGVWPNWGAFNRPGDQALTQFRGRYPNLEIKELPQQTLYPWNYKQTAMIFGEMHDVPPGCVGIHWFGGNNLSQSWNDKLTHENYRQFENTYTQQVRRMFGQ